MDESTILEYFEEKQLEYRHYSCEQLMHILNFTEHVEIEERRNALFFKRVEYICKAENFKSAIERDKGCKQIKRYLKKYCGIEDELATHTADKLNSACRVHAHFTKIVSNCSKCTNVDIRDLTIKELSLAVNISWVIRRSVLTKPNKKVPSNIPIEIDEGSVLRSIEELLNSGWYEQARCNPVLVANILNRINARVINSCIYARRK